MKLRYPAVPLVTHTPYFSVWSPDDVPNRKPTCHWTGKPQPLTGVLRVGQREYGFLGETVCPPMETVSVKVSACSTEYVLESPETQLTLIFTSPLLLDDLKLLTRPITYISAEVKLRKGVTPRELAISLSAGEALCLDHPGQSPVSSEVMTGKRFSAVSLFNTQQHVLNRSGDDVRIDWGTFYLAVETGGSVSKETTETGQTVKAEKSTEDTSLNVLFAVAYDEVKAIQYFGKDLDPLWKEEALSIPELLEHSFAEYADIFRRCQAFDRDLCKAAVSSATGDQRYCQLLQLVYRQAIAAHCICRDEDGKLLFISKECFSNGCAATADVSYPSMPLFLLYRPELVFAMMRPIMRYAASGTWKFDFAPHDAGRYPLLNGQAYGDTLERQMPVEECGNMLIMTAAATVASHDDSFAKEHWQLLTRWAEYLRKKGMDPDNQLCTDDFAGHLAHNCNLSIKAIMGVAAYGLLLRRRGEESTGEAWVAAAREMAKAWVENASNGDGTYRLAFDRPGTFSMKYNAVWDELLGLSIFPEDAWDRELASYLERRGPYGTPLDSRAGYTKSDWLVWVGSMMKRREDFEALIAPLWSACNCTPQRVPFTDWYETSDAWQVGFQNRTVVGGLFMRLLTEHGLTGSR